MTEEGTDMWSKNLWRSLQIGLVLPALSALVLLGAVSCGGGVSQEDYDDMEIRFMASENQVSQLEAANRRLQIQANDMEAKADLSEEDAKDLAAKAARLDLEVADLTGLAQAAKSALADQEATARAEIEAMRSFETVRLDWERKSKTGSLESHSEITTLAVFNASDRKKVIQKPGDMLVYASTGLGDHPSRLPKEHNFNKSGRVVVMDADTKVVLASNELPEVMAGSVQATVVSPDGRFVYISGAADPTFDTEGTGSPSTVIKIDALTLQPIKVLAMGGDMHHGQVFGDYLLIDTSDRSPGGLDVFLMDPNTDSMVSGIKDEDLGGSTYTAWGGPNGEFIYLLMEPLGYFPKWHTGSRAASGFRTGDLRWLSPFWVAKVDAATWEVVAEYPYPAYRSNWVQISADGNFMYVGGSGDDKVVKMDLSTGEVVWSQATGPGPYAIEVVTDNSEVWVADRGETESMFGRTITVIDNTTGRHLATIPSAYAIDHLILSPSGDEIWATSNGEGKIWVYNVADRELVNVIEMPGFGNAHGVSFVYCDRDGTSRVVADQGDFHNRVDPRNGRPINY